MNQPLHRDDERLPAVRARLFLLVRSLWKAGIVQVPLSVQMSQPPALQLLHPLWQRLRVELLGEQLLRDILPAIERQLVSEGELRREECRLTPNGPVDWPATWRRQFARPVDPPIVTRHWTRILDLPENYLAYQALHALAHDAHRALNASATLQANAPLSPEESAPLRRLRDRSRLRLQRAPWAGFSTQGATHFKDALHLFRRGTSHLASRRASLLSVRPAYAALLAWWQQWQSWHQPATGPHSLLDPDLEPKWLFELLLLFEVVAALSRYFPIRQSRALAENSCTPAFVAQTPAGALALFYQTGSMFTNQRSLKDIWGVPDMVLALPGHEARYLILDAKNYGPNAHTQAIYKMLGYLYQFGYNGTGKHNFDRILAGVLAFATNEREGCGLRNWQQAAPDAQAVMSFVLPPLPDERFTGLEELVTWLLEQIGDK